QCGLGIAPAALPLRQARLVDQRGRSFVFWRHGLWLRDRGTTRHSARGNSHVYYAKNPDCSETCAALPMLAGYPDNGYRGALWADGAGFGGFERGATEPFEAARSGKHLHHARGCGGIPQPGHALFDRQGLVGDAPPGDEGFLSVEAAIPPDARRHDVEVPRNDQVSRPDCKAPRAQTHRLT